MHVKVMMKIVIFIFVVLFRRIEGSEAIKYQTNEHCLDANNIRGIQQCQLCTRQKKSAEKTTVNRKCFSNGVYYRMFQCSNILDVNDYACDVKNNSTIVENVVTILPTTTKNENFIEQNWTGYFDITYGDDGSEYGTRLYVSKDSGCSDSTTFNIRKLNTPFQYFVHSRSISGII